MNMFLLGVGVGALIVSVLFALLNKTSRAVKEKDPADWWKNGGEPPY